MRAIGEHLLAGVTCGDIVSHMHRRIRVFLTIGTGALVSAAATALAAAHPRRYSP